MFTFSFSYIGLSVHGNFTLLPVSVASPLNNSAYLKLINRLYLIRGLKKIAKEKKKIKSNFIAASHDDMIMITGA